MTSSGIGCIGPGFFGDNITLENVSKTLTVNGTITPRMFIDTTTNKQITFSPDGVSTVLSLVGSSVTINCTTGSLNSTSASLVLIGGLSISCTTGATSITQGGSFTTPGGMAVAKSAYFGQNVSVQNTIVTSNISTLFASVGSLTISAVSTANFGSLNATIQNLLLSNISGNNAVFTSITGQNLVLLNNINSDHQVLIKNSNTSSSALASIKLDQGSGSTASFQLSSSNSAVLKNDTGTLMVQSKSSYLYLDTIGNIGVNNTSPSSTLSVNGTIGATSITTGNAGITNAIISNVSASTLNSFMATIGNVFSNQTNANTFNGTLAIQNTQNATSLSAGGSVFQGGLRVYKDAFFNGSFTSFNTTQSTSVSNGSAMFMGGVAVQQNLNVLGDTVLSGNLTVNGTTSNMFSQNSVYTDNIISLNAGPSGSKDAGFLINRYQTTNSIGSGDVVSDNVAVTAQVTSASLSIPASQVALNSVGSAVNDYYVNWWLKIGSGAGANQVRQITSYTASSRIASISVPWTIQPSSSDTVLLYNKPFIGFVFDETNNRFQIGSTAQDPTNASTSSLALTDLVPLHVGNITISSSIQSTSSTIGALVINDGGISITCTASANSVTQGGAFTTPGGIGAGSIYTNTLNVNTVKCTPNITDLPSTTQFTIGNNIPGTFGNVSFGSGGSVWGFDAWISARITATNNVSDNFSIRGVYNTSQGSWQTISQNITNTTSLVFGITSQGSLCFTSGNYSGFSNGVLKVKILTN